MYLRALHTILPGVVILKMIIPNSFMIQQFAHSNTRNISILTTFSKNNWPNYWSSPRIILAILVISRMFTTPSPLASPGIKETNTEPLTHVAGIDWALKSLKTPLARLIELLCPILPITWKRMVAMVPEPEIPDEIGCLCINSSGAKPFTDQWGYFVATKTLLL